MHTRAEIVFGCLALSAALFLSTLQIKNVILRVKTDDKTILVPGAAKRRVASDLALWRATLTAQAPESAKGYQTLAAALGRIRGHLVRLGVPAEELKAGSVSIREVCESKGCKDGGAVGRYEMSQPLEVRSRALPTMQRLVTSTAELVQAAALTGPELKFEARDLEFHFGRLEEMKFEVMAEAVRNARARAAQLAGAAGVSLGTVLSAQLGDVQTQLPDQPGQRYADDVASREKDIVANVMVRYALE